MYTSNVNIIVRGLLSKMRGLQQNTDPMLRQVAFAILPEIKRRVHVEGLASDGSQIGTYTVSYMAIRTGNFENADRFSRGAKKGQVKNAGTFTDRTIRLNKATGVFTGEEKAGKARPKYNRTSDTKVILSLTRQMENDLSVINAGSAYGIGYNNRQNYNKSQWAETTYAKRIWSLSAEERTIAITTANQYITELLK